MIELIMRLFFYLMPMYVANASAMLFGGKKRLDMGRQFMGQPLFGKGKTIEGTVNGIALGIIATFILNYFFSAYISLGVEYLMLGTLLSVGAIIGDIIATFIKRRIGMEAGAEFFPLDQLDFIFGGIVFGSFLFVPSLVEIGLIILITLFIHKAANFLAFKIRMKKVPW